jgi:CheY-like chemotaxis protein
VGVGTGIGLANVLAVTKSLGGRVDVESEVGRGAAFVLHFPCTDEEPPTARPAGPELRFRGRALLVEDNALARTIIRHLLEELGLDVLEAPDVTRALELGEASAATIDVCVSDVTLPDGTGPKTTSLLQERNPGIRVLFISAHGQQELADRGLLDAAAPMLQKPFGKEELAAVLAKLLPPVA